MHAARIYEGFDINYSPVRLFLSYKEYMKDLRNFEMYKRELNTSEMKLH